MQNRMKVLSRWPADGYFIRTSAHPSSSSNESNELGWAAPAAPAPAASARRYATGCRNARSGCWRICRSWRDGLVSYCRVKNAPVSQSRSAKGSSWSRSGDRNRFLVKVDFHLQLATKDCSHPNQSPMEFRIGSLDALVLECNARVEFEAKRRGS